MSNNPAFKPVQGVPPEIEARREQVKAPPGSMAPKRPSDEYQSIRPDERQYDDPNTTEIVTPNHIPGETHSTFQSFEDGAQTIAGSRADDITVSLPNRSAPVVTAPPPMAHIPPTPEGTPPARTNLDVASPAPIAPAEPTSPPPPALPAPQTAPPPAPALASSLPPPPMTVPTAAPQQLQSTTIPPRRVT